MGWNTKLFGILLFLSALLSIGRDPIAAQEEDGRIEGFLRNSKTDEPISGAVLRIYSAGYSLRLLSDGNGAFSASVPPGIYDITVSHPGFRTATLSVKVESGSTSKLDISIDPIFITIPEITVPGARDIGYRAKEAPIPSVSAFKAGQLLSIPGTSEDIFRSLRYATGVISTSDFVPQLYIRGEGPEHNIVFIDGIPVYSPYRLWGLISTFNSEMVESVELMAGGFPAKFGDRLSAVMEVRTREGRRDEIDLNFDANMTNMNYIAEGPMPWGSWLIGTRRTYYDLALKLFVKEDIVFPYFYDVQGKVSIYPSPEHKLSILWLDGTDALKIAYSRIRQEGESGRIVSVSAESEGGGGIWGLSWTFRKGGLNSNLVLSRTKSSMGVKFSSNIGYDIDVDVGTGEKGIRWDLSLGSIPSPFGDHRPELGIWLRKGDNNLRWRFDLPERVRRILEERPRGWGEGELLQEFESEERTWKVGIYAQDTWSPLEGLNLLLGSRYDRWSLTGKEVFSPRISGSLKLREGISIKGAWGIYSQFPSYEALAESNFLPDLSANKDLRPELSRHIIGGVDLRFGRISTRIEGYEKAMWDLIVPDPANPSIPVNSGRGRAYGLEISAEIKDLPDFPLSGWFGYSYAVTKRFIGDEEYIPQYDQRHTANAFINFRVTKRMSLGAILSYGSGLPYTPLSGRRYDEVLGRWVPIWGKPYSARLPYYLRLDLRIALRLSSKAGSLEIYGDLINALDRKNVYSYRWNEDYTERIPIYMFPRMPLLGIKVRF
jgi:outer membrane receptor protein involved in Fe transport